MRTTIYAAGAAALIALSALSVACHGSTSTSTTGSKAKAVASSTAVRADEQAAARLVQSCVTVTHFAAAKSCIESKVPPARRTALKQCLAMDAAAISGMHARKAFEAGAQACVAAALK